MEQAHEPAEVQRELLGELQALAVPGPEVQRELVRQWYAKQAPHASKPVPHRGLGIAAAASLAAATRELARRALGLAAARSGPVPLVAAWSEPASGRE